MRQNRSFFVPMAPPKRRSDRNSAAARPGKQRRKRKEASLQGEASGFLKYELLIFRLAVSAAIFAFVLISRLPAYADALLLFLACLLAGYDAAFAAGKAALTKDFTSDSFAVVLATFLSFPIGFAEEGTALIILYQVFRMLVLLLADRNGILAFEKIDSREENLRYLARQEAQQEGAEEIRIASVIGDSVKPILFFTMILAAALAVIMAGFLHYNLRVAIHRALSMIVVATPFSILAGMPVIGKVSLGHAAANGTVFQRAADLEQLDGTKNVLVEKSCFPEPEKPKILSYSSESLDDNTFFMLIRHLLESSEQAFAQVIMENTESRMIPDLVSDFAETPGGVEAVIQGSQAYFGTRSFLNGKGINPPEYAEEKGIVYYLYLAGRYGGKMVLSEAKEDDVSDIVHEMRYYGVNHCVLLSTESIEEVTEFSNKSEFDEVFAGINTENRLSLINELVHAGNSKTLCIRPVTFDTRSDADVEIRVGENIDDADAITLPQFFTSIPMLFPLSRRIREIAAENAILAFSVKAIMIFFSLIGYSNLWISITADMAAAFAAVMNSNRVTSKSLLKTFLNK